MFVLRGVGLALTVQAAIALQLFATPGDVNPDVPARCRVALTHNITCELLVSADQAQRQTHLVGPALEGYCSEGCRGSMAEFQKKVTEACGHTLHVLTKEGERKTSAQDLAEGFSWAQNLMCIKDG